VSITLKKLHKKRGIGTKTKTIERKTKKNDVRMKEKFVTKVVKNWLYKYHFSYIKEQLYMVSSRFLGVKSLIRLEPFDH